MINDKLLNPGSIVVVGGSDDITKPGGKVLKNLIDGNFPGKLFVVNPKTDKVQGIKSFKDVSGLEKADLAILAIPAKLCLQTVEVLASQKSTGAFIILSAGFGEESSEGKMLERMIVEVIEKHNGCLIGPNCIGLLNTNFNGVFTTPVPSLSPHGVDFISGSGATAVFIMESAIPNGLVFSSVWSVGNSAQTGVEDVLEYLDNIYVPGISSKVKLLYIESIEKPEKLFRHSVSLIRKGCRIAAIKSGSSDAGIRAASSHTGALASSDLAADALFRKAGIVRCNGRSELVAVASVFMQPLPAGKRIGIITHAGGPAVMLTDALSKGGMEVPALSGPKADSLKEKLFPGSSVTNPVDFLATGTAEQLGNIIDACENDFENIDAMAVIFGSPGLFPVFDVYELLAEKMRSCKKPIYPVLPSVINAQKEIRSFISSGNVFFPDETIFAGALIKVMNTRGHENDTEVIFSVDKEKIRSVIDSSPDGYLDPVAVSKLLKAAGIACVDEAFINIKSDLSLKVSEMGFPLAMKVSGPVHKSDVGGVVLNISTIQEAEETYEMMMKITGANGIIIQRMLQGTELFAGAKSEGRFGHVILAGLGGIFIEVLKDISSGLVPLSKQEAKRMISSLKGYDIIKGTRGKIGVDEEKYVEIICRLSSLVEAAPEIFEMDLNPLMGTADSVITVDARILIKRQVIA
jgi:acetyltransferase